MLAFAVLAAQTPQEPAPVFRSGASLVRIDVQVLDAGKPVVGLSRADFVVRDEGSERPIEHYGRESEPLELMLLLDVSGSMGKLLGEMASVANRALGLLGPQDRVGVALFARRSRVSLEPAAERTSAARALREAPFEKDLGAGTSINDALLETAAWWKARPLFTGCRAIIILTDNGGVHFRVPDESVIQALSGLDVVLDAIVPPSAKPPAAPAPSGNPDFTPADVFRLAEATGGEVLRASGPGARFPEMIERLRARYSLVIKPSPGKPGAFHRLEVSLTSEARKRYPKAEIRARAGYWADFAPAPE